MVLYFGSTIVLQKQNGCDSEEPLEVASISESIV